MEAQAVDHSHLRLGKKRVRRDKRSMRLETYLKELPPLAPTRDLTDKMQPFEMYLNDQLGDCVFAGIAHLIRAWTGNNGKLANISDNVVLGMYEKWAGYVPGDASTDGGAVELDALNKWRSEGVADDDGVIHKPTAHVLVEAANHEHVRAAVDMFGGAFLGLEMPRGWQTMDVWKIDYTKDMEPGGWGGHCVVAEAYDDDGLTVITWGERKRITWDALDVYAADKNGGEVHAVLSPDWADEGHPCPDGFDIDQLRSDLQTVTG